MKLFPALSALALLAVSIAFSEDPKVILDVQAIAGKSQEEVEKILGEPSGSEETKRGSKKFYRDETVEIVFIEGKADWITIKTGEIPVPFSVSAIESIGLESRGTDFRSAEEIRWGKNVDFVAVSAFGSEEGVSWFYVKVKTP